ncbi:hypothetical protein LJR039_005989 [Pseudorhodoferax sp. LjRoot39]|uniref:hypothetical protein n=1 Tax=Pseudorhodoferax sp. LjRoot39 TaxID=3342328 RepID=UPI003ECCE9CA
MKRFLIALASVLSVSAVVAFGPLSDVPPSAQEPMVFAAGWFADDGWALIATVVAMALIAKRRRP